MGINGDNTMQSFSDISSKIFHNNEKVYLAKISPHLLVWHYTEKIKILKEMRSFNYQALKVA